MKLRMQCPDRLTAYQDVTSRARLISLKDHACHRMGSICFFQKDLLIKRRHLLIVFGIVFLLFSTTGCRKHKTLEPTLGIKSPEETWIRVLLFGNLRECTVASNGGFTVEDALSSNVVRIAEDQPVRISRDEERIVIGQQKFSYDILLRPAESYAIEVNGRGYRGCLHLKLRSDGQGIQVVNHVPLESYLLGVIGAEMPDRWEMEALKAQAVASRTYCLFIKYRFGQNRIWDVRSSQAHQVYHGLDAESSRIKEAVLATSGQVLICRYTNGRDLLFPAYYSSSCGGHTENAEYVFGRSVKPLSGVSCPYCKKTAKRSDYSWPEVHYTMQEINEKLMQRYSGLAPLEEIRDFECTRKGFLDRITRIQLIGRNGKTDTLRGEDFRLALDPSGRKLKSAIFGIRKKGDTFIFHKGRGFGHGVGLCQCGAEEMARQENGYRTILSHYFPDSKLVRIEGRAEP